MSWEWLVGLLIGGGGAGTILSAYFTHKSNNQTHELNLLDRARKEIDRLDNKIKELEKEMDRKDEENDALKEIIQDLRNQMNALKLTIKKGEQKNG